MGDGQAWDSTTLAICLDCGKPSVARILDDNTLSLAGAPADACPDCGFLRFKLPGKLPDGLPSEIDFANES